MTSPAIPAKPSISKELLNSLVEAYSTQPASGQIEALITAVNAQ